MSTGEVDEGRQAWLRTVAADVARLDRSSSAERAADILRRSITEGALPPGAQLSEIELTEVLEVSAVALAKAGARVIAVDVEARNLDDTRERAEREGVRVETHHGPLAELAFVRADTIDAALSTYGLATVADLDRVFRQVHRVLRTDRPFVFSLPHPAFVMLDPAGGEPLLRRAWWDTTPVTWSTGTTGDEPDRAITLGMLFSALGRAGFAVDTVLEPPADRTAAGDAWSDAMRWVPPTLVVRARKLGT